MLKWIDNLMQIFCQGFCKIFSKNILTNSGFSDILIIVDETMKSIKGVVRMTKAQQKEVIISEMVKHLDSMRQIVVNNGSPDVYKENKISIEVLARLADKIGYKDIATQARIDLSIINRTYIKLKLAQ